MMLHIKIGNIDREHVLVLTDAPESYDGFGTFTVQKFDWPVEGYTRKDARVVATPKQHVDWQQMRYQSGMFAAWTETEALEQVGVSSSDDVSEILFRRLIGKEQN